MKKMKQSELYYILVKQPWEKETEYRKIGVVPISRKEKTQAHWQKRGFDVRTQLVKNEIEMPWQPMMHVKTPKSGERIEADIASYEKVRAIQRKQVDTLQKIMEYARLNYKYYQFDQQFKQLAEMIIDDSGIRSERDVMLEKLRRQIARTVTR